MIEIEKQTPAQMAKDRSFVQKIVFQIEHTARKLANWIVVLLVLAVVTPWLIRAMFTAITQRGGLKFILLSGLTVYGVLAKHRNENDKAVGSYASKA